MQSHIVTLTLFLMSFSAFSQEMGYDIFGTQTNPYSGPHFLLTLDTLKDAKTLNDINARYPSSWVANYLSVEVATTCADVIQKAVSTNDILTQEQLRILNTTDEGCRVDVVVDYIPENTLKYNPPRKLNFSLRVNPIYEAKYPGGFSHMKAYLKKNTIDKILETTGEPVEFAKVRFNITEEGKVSDARIFVTSEDRSIDQLILETICNMPKWSPAQNSKGIKITQEFEFSMGTLLLRCDYAY